MLESLPLDIFGIFAIFAPGPFYAVYTTAPRIFGGLTPIVVSLMMKSDPMAPALYVGAVCVLGAVTTFFIKNAPQAASSRR